MHTEKAGIRKMDRGLRDFCFRIGNPGLYVIREDFGYRRNQSVCV